MVFCVLWTLLWSCYMILLKRYSEYVKSVEQSTLAYAPHF